ncbi:MAG: HIT family protein [Candidatus Bipolaricaulia bacterium]
MREGCIFCRIAAGEVNAHRVYEDAETLAFLDIHPLTEGHTMVIPKQHYRKLEEMPVTEAGRLFETVRLVVEKVGQAMGTDSSTIGINNGRLAGQAVPHLHVHIVPRYPGDGGGTIHTIVHHPSSRSLDEVQKKIVALF